MNELREEMLRSLVYDPDTGVFRWKRKVAIRVAVGDEAGWVTALGYRVIRLCGKQWFAHRLAWLWVSGKWPVGEIDHINCDKLDNGIANLRDVSRATNNQNIRRARSHNKLGVLGVSRSGKRFSARIKAGGRLTHLGTFDSAEHAHAAYLEAKRELHGEAPK